MPDNGSQYTSVPSNSTPNTSEFELFQRGKQVFGKNAGGLIVRIKRYKRGNIALTRALIEIASTKHDPRVWIGRVLAGQTTEGEEPRVVEDARRDGLYYERIAPDRWKVGTIIYDGQGHEVGF